MTMSRATYLAVVCCIVTLAAAPVLAAQPTACPAPQPVPGSFEAGALEPLFLSTCTNCAPCGTDADCGGFRCVPILQSVLVCEGTEVCSLPDRVCSTSCNPCSTSSQCGTGESCIDVRLAFCIPQEECVTVLPKRVCECF